MTVQDRLAWAYRVSVLNLVMNVVIGLFIFVVFGFGLAGGMVGAMREGMGVPGMALLAAPVVLVIALLVLASLLLPLVVMIAIKKKSENWGIAAYVVLLYEIVTGGGFLILPIVTLVLLFDHDVHDTLMGRKPGAHLSA